MADRPTADACGGDGDSLPRPDAETPDRSEGGPTLHARAFDALDAQVAILDAGGVIRATNRSWETFGTDNGVGVSPDMVGVDYLAVCDDAEDEHATATGAGLRAVLAGDEEEFEYEYPCHSPDELRWFRMRVAPMTVGGERGLLVVHDDITQRRLAELDVAERNEQLEEVTSILSHDLRNPLTVALWRADMVGEDPADGEHLDVLESSLERMEAIIEDALLLARASSVDDVEPVDLRTAAEDAWDHVDTKTATLSTPGTATIQADASLLAQIFENLYRNALEHAGAEVEITVEPLPDGEGFAVGDDGPGIPVDDREKVFDPEFSTNDAGTGFGLAIVRRISKLHDWAVSAGESEAGGARFAFTGVDVD